MDFNTKRLILTIFISALFAGNASAFTVTETGKHSTAGYAYDVASSMDYLYIADTTGLQIYNITDEHLAASFSELRRLTSVSVYEDKAYVVSDGQLYLLNISIPFEPQVVRQIPFYTSAKDVSAYGNYVFATNGGLMILNASNEFRTAAQFTYSEDSGTPEYSGVATSGDLACVASAKPNESGFKNVYLVNIANPNNPWLMSKFSTVSTSAFPHYPQDVAIQGKYVYAVDRRFGIFVVDISNRYDPRIVAQLNPFQEEPIGIAVAGDRAFVTTGTNWYVFKINDGNPPDIAIASPREGQVSANNTIIVRGSASDDSGIRSVLVNGIYAGNNTWSREITLSPGLNNITIAAIDYSGNVKEKIVTVRYSPPTPAPTPTMPAPSSTPSPSPSPTATKSAMGFDIILAITGVMAIYLLRRND